MGSLGPEHRTGHDQNRLDNTFGGQQVDRRPEHDLPVDRWKGCPSCSGRPEAVAAYMEDARRRGYRDRAERTEVRSEEDQRAAVRKRLPAVQPSKSRGHNASRKEALRVQLEQASLALGEANRLCKVLTQEISGLRTVVGVLEGQSDSMVGNGKVQHSGRDSDRAAVPAAAAVDRESPESGSLYAGGNLLPSVPEHFCTETWDRCNKRWSLSTVPMHRP